MQLPTYCEQITNNLARLPTYVDKVDLLSSNICYWKGNIKVLNPTNLFTKHLVEN